jgi:glutamate-5-semialdehyde dehydrogenase
MLNDTFIAVKAASRQLNLVSDTKINKVLRHVADTIDASQQTLLAANCQDLDRMSKDDPKYDRLKLTAERLTGIARDMRRVAELESPLNKVLSTMTRPNGMTIKKVSVPFGVIGIIYEARPNVTFDVFSLCLKSGNAVIMKGSADADCSNCAILELIHKVLIEEGLDENTATLLPATHEAAAEMMNAVGYIDLIIPRGGSGLIHFVRDHSKVPVIETGAGICHTYFHTSGDIEKGKAIIFNAKTRRVSVCNAMDSLLIDRSRIADLQALVASLATKNVIIYADDEAYKALEGKYPLIEHATEENWGTEYLDYKMSLHVVADIWTRHWRT